jgi:hypothetical protein
LIFKPSNLHEPETFVELVMRTIAIITYFSIINASDIYSDENTAYESIVCNNDCAFDMMRKQQLSQKSL